MSVLKNKRCISALEYDRSFGIMYDYTMLKLNSIPRRRQSTLSAPFTNILKETYRIILEIETNYDDSRNKKAKDRYDNIKKAIKNLQSLQSPLFTLWNIVNNFNEKDDYAPKISDKQKAYWVQLINNELIILQGCLKKSKFYNQETDGEIELLMYYKNSDLHTAKFLGSMSKLQRITHSYNIRMSPLIKDTDGALLLELANDAWYYCVKANEFPQNKTQYLNRRKYISKAITCLYNMNKPMIKVFNVMRLSDKQMTEWGNLVNNTKNMLISLQESDKRRFSDLTD